MITKVINVNLHQPIYERLTAKQGDIASRYLLFHLLDGDKPFDLTGKSVRVYARKPDKTEIFNDLTINDARKGYCTLELTSQCLAEAGIVKMELYISQSGKVLTSIPFELEVIACINTVNSVTSTNEFSALEVALSSLQDYDNLRSEIVQARKGHETVGQRLDNFDSQLDKIETVDLINTDLLLFASYQSGNLPSVNDFTLYVGKDCEKCYPINNDKIIKFNTNRPLWDIACFYANDKFYFIGDYKDNDEVWGGNAFLLIESEDLINFKQTPFKITSSTKNITQTWAPKIFEDGGQYYLIYCIQENNQTYVDTNLLNISHPKLKMCYSVALDNSLTKWSEPKYFNINSNEGYIDPFVIKKDNVYHLFGCYDNNAEIRHFTSPTLDGEWQYNSTIQFPTVTEAPSVVFFNNKYYMFVDSHRATGGRDSGLIQVMESNDLYGWSNLKTYKNTANTKMRHFAPLVINTNEQKNVIDKLFKKLKLNNNYIDGNNSSYTSEKNNISYFDLASITPKSTKTINELTVMPNTIYYMNSHIDSITINKINASKLKNFETFSFVLNSFGNSVLTIKNNSNKGTFLPTRKDLIIDGFTGSVIYTFTVLDGYIKAITPLKYTEGIRRGNGVANGENIVTTAPDFECKYIVYERVCVVSYIIKFTKEITRNAILVTGLPLPEMGILFNCPLDNTDEYNQYGTFKIDDAGNIIEWYGSKPKVNTVIKGSFTYIIK